MDAIAALDLDGPKWVFTGIPPKSSSLKPISTGAGASTRRCHPNKNMMVEVDADHNHDDYEDYVSTTPTGRESRIPIQFSCPPAPRKRRPSSTSSTKYHLARAAAVEFFVPPDLESVFTFRTERAN